jgi:hypothetical protein
MADASVADTPGMPGTGNEPRQWTCAACGRRVFRVEAAAAAIAVGSAWQVRFDVLGACREHQPQVRQQLATTWPTSVATRNAHVRPDALATWAATARKELLIDAEQVTTSTR